MRKCLIDGSLTNPLMFGLGSPPFAAGQSIDTNGKHVEFTGEVLGSHDGSPALINSQYQGGSWNFLEGITICKGSVLGGNTSVIGDGGAKLIVQTTDLAQTYLLQMGGHESGYGLSSRAGGGTSFGIHHDGPGRVNLKIFPGYQLTGDNCHISGFSANNSKAIEVTLKDLTEHFWRINDWSFDNFHPMYFKNWGLVDASSCKVTNCRFSVKTARISLALKLDGHQDSKTIDSNRDKIFSGITVDGAVELRYLGGYTIDDWIVCQVRTTGYSDKDAASQDDWLVLNQQGDAALFALAKNHLMRSYGFNPHGWQLNAIRSSGVIEGIIHENHSLIAGGKEEPGDGFQIASGDSNRHYIDPVELTIDHAITISRGAAGNVGLTVNGDTYPGQGAGQTPRINYRNSLICLDNLANGIHLNEDGPNAPGTIGDVEGVIFYAKDGDGGKPVEVLNPTTAPDGIISGRFQNNSYYGLAGLSSYGLGDSGRLVDIDPEFLNDRADFSGFDPDGAPRTVDQLEREFLNRGLPQYDPAFNLKDLLYFLRESYNPLESRHRENGVGPTFPILLAGDQTPEDPAPNPTTTDIPTVTDIGTILVVYTPIIGEKAYTKLKDPDTGEKIDILYVDYFDGYAVIEELYEHRFSVFSVD